MSVTHLHPGRDMAASADPPAGHRPTWALIDLDAITFNARTLAGVAQDSALMAVVKADGYGHGAVPVARAALRGGARWLAVALIEEGRRLRAAGIAAPILLLTEPPATAIGAMLDVALTPTVYTPAFIAALDTVARSRGGPPVDVHLKLDTGMRRVGTPPADWDAVMTLLAQADGIRVAGLWSHLACADDVGHPSVQAQARTFREGIAAARAHGLTPDLLHLCNSAGTLLRREDHFDLVRCGIALYGLDPGNGVSQGFDLRPAMRWVSRVSLAKRLAAGEAVSYGHMWAPEHETTVATVPAGYADGVTRRLGGVGAVVVGGRRRPIVGRVCMDQFLVDVGDDDIDIGDEVVLVGTQDGASVTADDWAGWLDTITYEVVCGVGARVPRVYTGNRP